MAVETELYLINKCHFSTGVGVTVSASAGGTTDPGYNIAWIQDANLTEGWKGPDGTADFNILIDGLVNTWLNSSATGTIYWAMMYDARATWVVDSIVPGDQPCLAPNGEVTTVTLNAVGTVIGKVIKTLTVDDPFLGIEYTTW